MFRIPSSRDEIFDRMASDVQSNLPNTNPQKQQSWLRSILASMAGSFYDLYFQLKESIDTYFYDTTYGEYLERKASNNGIFRAPATGSTGNVVFTGIATTSIPSGTLLNGVSNSIQYQTLTTKTITTQSLSVLSLTYSAGIATVITNSDHNLVTDVQVTISGATPAGLNGTFAITSITDEQTFQYEMSVVGSGTATGTILCEFTTALVDVESLSVGADTNLSLNEQLLLLSPIVGVNNTAKVTYDELGGGADIEDDESLRSRLIYKLQNPVTLFNAVQIELLIRTLSFVERVFIFPITPAVGQVTIYVLKENNVLPNATELQLIKDLIEDTILPINTSINDVFVLAPTPVTVNFNFTSITPNTDTMKTSITNNLIEFFNNKTEVGQDIYDNQYLSAIQSTIDTDSGEILEDFTLSTPSGDITITAGQIGVLGTVTFV